MNLIRVGDLIINMDQVFSVEWMDRVEVEGETTAEERVHVTSVFPEMRYVLKGLKARTFWKFLQNKLSEVKV